MSIETTLETCIICERPLTQENVAIPGMPVCKQCMQGHPQAGNSIAIFPPPRVLGRRLMVILPGMVIGLVVGCIASLLILALLIFTDTAQSRTAVVQMFVILAGVCACLGSILFTLLWEIIFFSRLQHAGNTEWKSHIIKKLNLESTVQRTQATPHLVVCCWQRPRLLDVALPMQIGILLETVQGFIFYGTQGMRAILPFTGIATVGIEQLKMFPPRTAIRFDLNTTEGLPIIKGQEIPKQVFFAFMDEDSFKANTEKARVKQQHIQHIIGSSGKVETKV
jgi:hypothetical protein